LEKLQIADIYFSRFFAGHSENNSGSSQSSVAKIESKCSFMPSTLKFLLILGNENTDDEDYENPDDLVNILLSLLANCPQLRFMHIFINTEFDLFKLIEERNPRELDKIIRFVILLKEKLPNIRDLTSTREGNL
jgi:predicted MPP superfamily phosphohydrolase